MRGSDPEKPAKIPLQLLDLLEIEELEIKYERGVVAAAKFMVTEILSSQDCVKLYKKIKKKIDSVTPSKRGWPTRSELLVLRLI